MSAALHLVPYALVAAASPLGLAATLTVMRSGRLKALGFALGVLAGQAVACGVLVVIGQAVVPDPTTRRPGVQGALELLLGLGLLVLAVAVRRRPDTVVREPDGGRSHVLLERLGRMRMVTAVAAGGLLGIGGPKRLVLSSLASASITASGVAASQAAALVGWYAVLATIVVWAPVLAYVLLGRRAVTSVDAGFAWLARHRRPVTFYALLFVAVLLVADGLTLL